MGVCQWLVQKSLVPGEPSVDRARKELLVPVCIGVGTAMFIWGVASLPRNFGVEGKSEFYGRLLGRIATFCGAFALLPVGAYIVQTGRVTTRLCEATAFVTAFGTILGDAGWLLQGLPSAVSVNILVLDALLLCSCSESATRVVLAFTAVWICARSGLEGVNVTGDECFDGPSLFSYNYTSRALNTMLFRLLVLVVDFIFTRGFARSMHEQKAQIEASICVSEAAAVRLSRYETEETESLLLGPDGRRLPDGLREALLQLVTNLALYRPYLPQSCLPDGGSDADDSRASSGCKPQVNNPRTSFRRLSSRRLSDSDRADDKPCGLVAVDVKPRKVSLVAVNSRSCLDGVRDRALSALRSFINGEVEVFAGMVAGERGLVDLISGDHMFATFNAARLCTTHRASAARVAWGTTREDGARTCSLPPGRTGCACSGTLVCGDLGTSDARRFMLVGSTFNVMLGLERVAAKLSTVLVDETVGADADVRSGFESALLERLLYEKAGPKPFLVWQLTGMHRVSSAPDEWMYELEKRAPNPHRLWNRELRRWLDFDGPFETGALAHLPSVASAAAVTGQREQSYLVEATVTGATIAFHYPAPKKLSCGASDAPHVPFCPVALLPLRASAES